MSTAAILDFSVAPWRDRLLGSPKFRQWAAAFPLTRPIARRRARALFDLCAGFVYAQVLHACVRLNLFAILAEGPQTTAILAHRMALTIPAAERLLTAAVALKLVNRRKQLFGLGALGAAMVENPGLTAMVEHHAVLYEDLRDPVALLRGESLSRGLSAYWGYANADSPSGLSDREVAPYTALMAASQPMISEQVVCAYPLGRHKRLLDVGGGDGSFAAFAAVKTPGLYVDVFDLPSVAELARLRFAASGLTSRATVSGGNFLTDPLPEGADIASLVRVIHDHGDESARIILNRVYTVLPPGGTLLLAEPMSGTAGAEPVGDAYFGFYLLAMGSGRPRSPQEFKDLLAATGFAQARLLRTRMPLLTRLIVATKARA